MNELLVEVRASSVPEWADCQARAGHARRHPGPLEERPHVGAVVGTLVHAMLLEKDARTRRDAWAAVPPYIEWDQHTRNAKEMSRQVGVLYATASLELHNRGWEIQSSEVYMLRETVVDNIRVRVTGHLDAVIMGGSKTGLEYATLELKTGAHKPRGAWMQAGTYAWLWDKHPGRLPLQGINRSVVLWLSRKDESVIWEEREAAPLMDVAAEQVQAIGRAHAHGPTFNPSSLGCKRCLNNECPVRFEGEND